jgi:hypothetical protein
MDIGLAEVECTPAIGLPLMGNYRDDYAARGIHDPLYARAVVFRDDAGESTALVSVDVCMLGREPVAAVRHAASQATGLRAEDILVAATHTHSSLAVTSIMGLPTAPAEAASQFVQRVVQAVIDAWQNLAPAELAVGYAAESRLSFNRRLRYRDGRTHMNWELLDPQLVAEPLGPIDERVATLWLRQGGRTAGAIVNFGLHPAILAGDNWLYSADWPGYLVEALRRSVAPDLIALFFNGCCGDVNHLDYSDPLQGRGYKMAERVGYMVAAASAEACRAANRVPASPVPASPVRVSRERVTLPRWRITDEQYEWSREVLRRAAGQAAPGQTDGLPDELYAQVWLQMRQRQDQADEAEVMAVRLGEVAIVALPGEVFCELGLAIRRASPAPHTLVVELANDAIGYVPTRRAFADGGYETTPGSTCYEPGAGELLVDSALRQLTGLFASP